MIKKSRLLFIGTCLVLVLGVAYILSSILSHDANDPQCACMLCTNNRLPADGEYLYNHYLFVLSIIWIAFMVITGYVVKERAKRVTRKNLKKRNR